MEWLRLWATVLVALVASAASAAIPTSERDALVTIFQATGGDDWATSTGWNGAGGTECSWFGVQCDSAESTVIGLSLDNNGLTGFLPSQIGDLRNLELLNLESNQIAGSLPSELGNLTRLTFLSLPNNQFSGEIPGLLTQLAALEHLFLQGNRLSGTIPPALGGLSKLKGLYLSGNQLTGSIPGELGDLSALEDLVLDTNRLSGEIPAALARLRSLRLLYLHGNELTGAIPRDLGMMSSLEELALYSNKLSGEIPVELAQLPNLRVLALEVNRLSGPIRPELGLMSKLEVLDLSSNQLTGRIPPQLGQLSSLRILHLGDNRLDGPIPGELSLLSRLEELHLEVNRLSGTIPEDLGTLSNLQTLLLNQNELTGRIPLSLASLLKLTTLYLYTNRLEGPIPADLQKLTNLGALLLAGNQFTGQIPPELMNLTNLTYLALSTNLLEGPIPQQIGNLAKLEYLELHENQLSGSIPAEVGRLSNLLYATFAHNQLTGALPPLSQLKKLTLLNASNNFLEGPIPTDIGELTSLEELGLGQNMFEGKVPAQIGNLVKLRYLGLDANALRGPIPREILNLTSLLDAQSDFGYNALFTSDSQIRDFLNRKQYDRDWEASQTVTPADFRVSGQTGTTVILSWDRIRDLFTEGGYQISVSTSPGGAPLKVVTTPDKTFSAFAVDELSPQTTYFFTLSTVTYPNDYQKNLLVSDPSAPIAATTAADMPSPPQIVVTTFPFGLVQSEGAGEDRPQDFYVLKNFGDMPTTLTLTQQGSFFTQDPTTFTLEPGEEAGITLTGVPQPPGAYVGASIPTGGGVEPNLRIPVHLLSVVTPTGTVIAQAATNRIDIAATEDVEVIPGTARFSNAGNAALNGILVADVAWLIPQSDLVVIPPGQSTEVAFQIDRRLRSDDEDEGTATGTLSLLYLQATSTSAAQLKRALQSTATVNTAVITVVDTVKPPVSASAIPPLAPNEVALLIPGVGNLVGGGGLRFLSDVSIANAFSINPLGDVRMFFTPEVATSETTAAPVSALAPNTGLQLGDIVKSVFNSEGQAGTLQIRTQGWDRIAVSANIFNVSNPAGTYGTVIPVFRSDRALRAGEQLFLTGLRKTPTTRTNLFLQETSGQPAGAQIEFFDANGTPLGTLSEPALQAFRLRRIFDQVPAGAVTARVSNISGSAGRIVAYATPLDAASGDFWSVADWTRQFASKRNEPMLIPVAGTVRGARDTFFRTDVDVANIGTASASATLRYYPQVGDPIDRTITVGAGQTRTFLDIVGDLFGVQASLGYVVFTPRGSFAVTSRTYATVGDQPGTFGSGTPTLPLDAALRLGQSQVIGGIEIASTATINAGKPGTFRTNIGLIETSGEPATVRATLFYADARAKAFGPLRSFVFELQPRQSRLITNLNTLLEDFTRGDLRNAQLQFDVIAGAGAVVIYTSSVDNGTGDSVFRLE